MTPLWLTDSDVERLLNVEEAVPVVEAVLKQQALGLLRICHAVTRLPGPGVMLAHMMAALHEQGVFGFKVYSIVDGAYRFSCCCTAWKQATFWL